jgi:DNA-binding NarL/FixJ family response regulator
VHVSTIRAAPPARFAVWLREEARRDEHLYAALNERYGLQRRAFQLALLVRQGLTNREIARELRLSESTVKIYLHHLYQACGVRSRTALVALMDKFRRSE